MKEDSADVIVVGGGLGGCAAALAAARNGKRVIMTEETDWIGGQCTAQAVPPDEHRWVETYGITRSYREFRRRIRDYYRRNYPLTPEARAREHLNPGNGSVSRICHEPRVSLAVLYELLAAYLGSGLVRILLNHRPVAAEIEDGEVRSVTVEGERAGDEIILGGDYFLDATELGDVLPLTKTEYVTGAESKEQTGELHSPDKPQPQNMQAFTCCFVLEYLEGEDHTIEKPRDYAFWKSNVPDLKPSWPGPLLSFENTHPVTLKPRTSNFDPARESTEARGLWHYRRIADRANFRPGLYRGDITLVNWPQNDYWLGNLYEVSEREARKHLDTAKQLSLSWLYWLQTEAPRADGGQGWRGLRLRNDIVDTDDGLAKYPYIRESRRIKAEFTVLEQHVGRDARMQLTGKNCEQIESEVFPDSVGIGYYRIDLHPSSGGDNYIDVDSLPFQIPLGALIPQRVENLLPACKNLGVTHITNGCYRLHPVEWNIGEAAGALAAFCNDRKTRPRHVRNTPRLLHDFQSLLADQGVELAWPPGTRA
ncbi:MAG: FAD-dependent oxidoreductase [Candidatus Hydrogenedentes bacterium]|nr:FAD-dependent oxidoreductase [Candidatus Hydrogenedentota bacterium]